MAVTRIAAAILAGGKSSRMGQNKAFLPFRGKPLICWVHQALAGVFDQVFVVGPRAVGDLLRVKSCSDFQEGEGPSSNRGIYTGLIASPTLYTFFAPCDMPFLNPAALREMREGLPPGCDAYVPRRGEYWQPLHALYSKNCLPWIETQLKKKDFKIYNFYDKVRTCTMELDNPDLPWFFNINTMADLKRAEEMALQIQVRGEKSCGEK